MNKIRQTIVGLLLIIPFLSFAQQAPLWKVAIKNKTIEWTSQNDTSTIKLMNTKKAIIDFSYQAPEKVANSTQAIIMMDNVLSLHRATAIIAALICRHFRKSSL